MTKRQMQIDYPGDTNSKKHWNYRMLLRLFRLKLYNKKLEFDNYFIDPGKE